MKSFANFRNDVRFTAKLKSLKKSPPCVCFRNQHLSLLCGKIFFARCAHENLFIWVRKASPEGSEKGRRQMLINGLRVIYFPKRRAARGAQAHNREARSNWNVKCEGISAIKLVRICQPPGPWRAPNFHHSQCLYKRPQKLIELLSSRQIN